MTTGQVFSGLSVLEEHRDPERIEETIRELQRRHEAAHDYNIPAKDLALVGINPDEETLQPTDVALRIPWMQEMPAVNLELSETAHQQLHTRLGIHGSYYRKMRNEAPVLLPTNVNHWLAQHEGSLKIRELDGKARAIVTPNYRALDNMPALLKLNEAVERAGAKLFKLDLSDDAFFARALLPDWAERIEHQHRDVREEGAVYQTWLTQSEEGYFHRYGAGRDIPDEDWVIPGMNFRNSETGRGGMTVEYWLLRVICMNGTTMMTGFKRVHLGAAQADGLVVNDEVRQRENELIFAQMAAAVEKIFDREHFRELVKLMTESTTVSLGDAPKTIERVADKYDLRESETESIVNRILYGGDPTVFGLVQAVTSLARDEADADRQYELEQVGGQILEDPRELVVVRR